jgi:hypothetical protein
LPNLIAYTKDNPILVAWCNALRRKALRARREVARKKDLIHDMSVKITNHHTDLLLKIVTVRNRIRLIRKGEPATEALDPVDNTSQLDDNLSDADRFLLKKAYRKAAALTHPDKGGSVEDFQSVQAAYAAGDLTSLNEFFLLQEESLQDRIEYWLQQPAVVHVEWIRFQATNEYAVVAMYQRGQRDEAIELAGKFLRLALVVAEREELDLLASMSGVRPSPDVTVNKHHEGSHID